MSINKNVRLALKGFEAFNRQDKDALMELFADNFTYDSVTRYKLDKEGYLKFLNVMYTTFPDIKLHVDRIISQGNTVVAETTITGTHKKEYLGIPATGKSIKLPAVYIFDLEAGKVKLTKYYANLQSLLEQLRE